MNTITSVSARQLEYQPIEKSNRGIEFCVLSNDRGKRIFKKTMANHVEPRYWPLLSDEGYFYCSNSQCPVIYFNNNSQNYFGESNLHSTVMHKIPINSENRPMCYCKNVLEKQILDEILVKKCCDSIKDIQRFTEANTGKDCVITNPTGRCCGTQIRELLVWVKNQNEEIEVPLMEEAMSCCIKIEEATGLGE